MGIPKSIEQPGSLPVSRAEMARLGWAELDVLLISGDAYVDHPAFGTALLGRRLVAAGYRVGVAAQPRWDTDEDIAALGRPRLWAGITAGALDSMLAHYTAFRQKRRDDAYTPGGRAGARPNRATIVYASLARHAFPGLPVIVGGIEASLRRFTHYDFWSDRLRRSLLFDSKADLLVYGMGERAALEISGRLAEELARVGEMGKGRARVVLAGIPGTVTWANREDEVVPAGDEAARLPSHEEIETDPARLVEATRALERQVQRGSSWAVQASGDRVVVAAPPAAPLTTAELDSLYGLPFSRRPHPSYSAPVPAAAMIQFSITAHRGCAGGCSFCSLALHQGRRIASRSRRSIIAEVRELTRHPDFKGSITDVGGPTANLWNARCGADPAACARPSCLHPKICAHLQDGQSELAAMLEEAAAQPGVKHLRVASGIRHDLALRDRAYLDALVGRFVGGQLKLAPEHSSARVLALMRKPDFAEFERFLGAFHKISRAAGKDQYTIPYLITALPGETEADLRALADWLAQRGWKPQQVQCFIPTPGTLATAMYFAGVDPEGRRLPVARSDAERRRRHELLLTPSWRGGGR